MRLHHLQCFVAAAEELHFGRAAQRLGMLPAAFGRFIRLLEDDLGTRLFDRTTRTVALTQDGATLLTDARRLTTEADMLRVRFRESRQSRSRTLRLGAIDSAAVGLIPALLNDFRDARPDVTVELLEDRSVRLIPKLASGRIDLAIIRPPRDAAAGLVLRDLLQETVVVALHCDHPLAARPHLTPADLVDEPLIVPDRRMRPHSHDLSIKIMEETGRRPRIAQVANEKQTIVHLVSTGLGLALVPRWTSGMRVDRVAYVPLLHRAAPGGGRLPLAVAWMGNARDEVRDALTGVLFGNIARYAEGA